MAANGLGFPWSKKIDSLGVTGDEYLKQSSIGMTDAQIAEVITKHTGRKVTFDIVNSHRRRLGIYKTGGPNTAVVGVSPYAKYDSPPLIEADKIVILGDVQAPYTHSDFTNRVLDLAKAWGVKHSVLAGDLLEFSSLTHFDPQWVDQRDIETQGIPDKLADDLISLMDSLPKSVKAKMKSVIEKHGRQSNVTASGAGEEWHHARKTIRRLVEFFDHSEWIMGNHCGRLLRQIQSPLVPNDLKRLFADDSDKVHISPYYFCELISNHVKWRVIHPKSAGRDDPQIYASKLLTNIIMCHSHHWNFGKDRSGKFFSISNGCLVDERLLAYVATRDQKTFQHLLGATFIMYGKPYLVGEDTDFDAMGKMYQ